MTGRATATERMPVWLAATVAGGFGLFYAYFVWNALAYLLTQATGVFGLNALGWAILLFAVVFPILVFAGGFALGIRRSAGRLALVLLAGLGLVAVFWLDVLAYSYSNGTALVGV
jgi:hypothetical protein